MTGSNENIQDGIRPTKAQGGGGLKSGYGKSGAPIGQNRRALSDINKNIIRTPPAYPYAVNPLPGHTKSSQSSFFLSFRIKISHLPVTRTFSAQVTSKSSLTLQEELLELFKEKFMADVMMYLLMNTQTELITPTIKPKP